MLDLKLCLDLAGGFSGWCWSCWRIVGYRRPRGFRCVWPVREVSLEGEESCPAVLSRKFRWTNHVYCVKQEPFLSGIWTPFNNLPLDTSSAAECVWSGLKLPPSGKPLTQYVQILKYLCLMNAGCIKKCTSCSLSLKSVHPHKCHTDSKLECKQKLLVESVVTFHGADLANIFRQRKREIRVFATITSCGKDRKDSHVYALQTLTSSNLLRHLCDCRVSFVRVTQLLWQYSTVFIKFGLN